MARIEDLITEIADTRLRTDIAREVASLKRQKKFGLVFEEHIPEQVHLPSLPVKHGLRVVKGNGDRKKTYVVERVHSNGRTRIREENGAGAEETVRTKDLVPIKRFGESIYPTLTPVARITRAPDKPYHTLINADNFHALQLLVYCCEAQVDVIYIDPPYNTGARDWKYNNDYVDASDQWRHSKWLSMMKKRLLLAKRLLAPHGVIVVAIDENELHHLRCLLGGIFDSSQIQQVCVVTNPKGVTQGRFSRVEEYLLFVFSPGVSAHGQGDDYLTPEPDEGFAGIEGQRPRWKGLLRSGTNARRADRPNLFYPVLIDPRRGAVVGTGEPLPIDEEPDVEARIDGMLAAWPIRTTGEYGNWGVGHTTLRSLIANGYVSLGAFDEKRHTWAVSYLSQRLREQIESGVLEIVSVDKERNVADVRYSRAGQRRIKTVWKRSRHDAGAYGSGIVKAVLGRTEAFSFPKSLYAVADTLRPLVRERKDALILDFFAGSGTTYHATALLNAEDAGKRRCILVTNNEVEERLSKELRAQGICPGDPAFERHRICESVTWPRCKYATQGQRDDGTVLPGRYIDGGVIGEGLAENIEFFRLDFLDPHEIAYGERFEAIVPLMWLMAGAMGGRETVRGRGKWFIPSQSPYAVLIREEFFTDFARAIQERADIALVFLVTDSEEAFCEMATSLPSALKTRMLYKSYLDNFRINMETLL